jgi:signal transduction histidine kinase
MAHVVVVKKHQGTLTFETELEKGTTFIVRLPLPPSSLQQKDFDETEHSLCG